MVTQMDKNLLKSEYTEERPGILLAGDPRSDYTRIRVMGYPFVEKARELAVVLNSHADLLEAAQDVLKGVDSTVTCAACGKGKGAQVEADPEFGFRFIHTEDCGYGRLEAAVQKAGSASPQAHGIDPDYEAAKADRS